MKWVLPANSKHDVIGLICTRERKHLTIAARKIDGALFFVICIVEADDEQSWWWIGGATSGGDARFSMHSDVSNGDDIEWTCFDSGYYFWVRKFQGSLWVPFRPARFDIPKRLFS